MISLPDHTFNIKSTKYHRQQPKEGEQYLAPLAAQLPTIGHAFIFDKMQFEPGTQNELFFTKVKIGFDPYFKCLVKY